MRGTRILTNGIKKYVWDVFERPYYTWDKYERPYYTWDVYVYHYKWAILEVNITYTQVNENYATPFYIPFNGGYYRANGYYIDQSTGKFSLAEDQYLQEITANTDTSKLNSSIIGDHSGLTGHTYLYSQTNYDNVVKDTANSRWVITPNKRYKTTPNYLKGDDTGDTVMDANPNKYPENAYDSVTGFWYERYPGTFLSATGSIVTSPVADAYPTNGYDEVTGLFYVRRSGTTLVPTGEQVTSFNASQYPLNDYHAATGYWYIRVSYTKTPTGNIVKSQYPTAYPALGYDDVTGYWYEKRAMS